MTESDIHTLYREICAKIGFKQTPALVICAVGDPLAGYTNGKTVVIDAQKIIKSLRKEKPDVDDDVIRGVISYTIGHELAHAALMRSNCNDEGIIKAHGWRFLAVAAWIYEAIGYDGFTLIDRCDSEVYRVCAGPGRFIWPLERRLAECLFTRLSTMRGTVHDIATAANDAGRSTELAAATAALIAIAAIPASTYF